MKYTSEFEYIKYINLESPPQVYFWVWKNASIQKVYFKCTSNFDCKFVSFESLLQVYFWHRKEIQMHFKKLKYKVEVLKRLKYTWSIIEVYLKYTLSNLKYI